MHVYSAWFDTLLKFVGAEKQLLCNISFDAACMHVYIVCFDTYFFCRLGIQFFWCDCSPVFSCATWYTTHVVMPASTEETTWEMGLSIHSLATQHISASTDLIH